MNDAPLRFITKCVGGQTRLLCKSLSPLNLVVRFFWQQDEAIVELDSRQLVQLPSAQMPIDVIWMEQSRHSLDTIKLYHHVEQERLQRQWFNTEQNYLAGVSHNSDTDSSVVWLVSSTNQFRIQLQRQDLVQDEVITQKAYMNVYFGYSGGEVHLVQEGQAINYSLGLFEQGFLPYLNLDSEQPILGAIPQTPVLIKQASHQYSSSLTFKKIKSHEVVFCNRDKQEYSFPLKELNVIIPQLIRGCLTVSMKYVVHNSVTGLVGRFAPVFYVENPLEAQFFSDSEDDTDSDSDSDSDGFSLMSESNSSCWSEESCLC